MIDEIPDWAMIEAAKRVAPSVDDYLAYAHGLNSSLTFRALCDMIAKHEQPPVDRKVLCAREAWRLYAADHVGTTEDACRLAIELWEEGFGA
jgi:hypothetical protein